MPGILPMKVIKIGSNAQPRIAQACDRCRSKKIRCDGIRPSCTQCSNVGFECKTSDKLSRRAFPRGYTESLEERVRALEQEVRELKDLLDEKDEKLDVLSRIRSGSLQSFPSPKQTTNTTSTPSSSVTGPAERPSLDENDVFKVTQSPILVNEEQPNTYYMGTSSGRSLICALKRKLQEMGKTSTAIDVNAFFTSKSKDQDINDPSIVCHPPAVMLSDRLVQIFFQEFAPLFPILHRPTFLKLYHEFLSSSEVTSDNKTLAQLYLVFGIAALSTQSGAASSEIEACESQFRIALETFQTEESLLSVQCLTLATLYFMMKADYASMLKYKGHAIGLSQRLGLHQTQKRFTFDALTIETRRRVFWSLFTLDCFSAAHLGLPTLVSNTNVHCEYPVDADDEYVTEKGFLPTLPGKSTELSSALAFFKLSRVLSNILEELYPASASYELSFRKIAALQDELDNWSTQLAPHLRLHFEKDKPSTRIVSDRSPLISLAYQYTHSLLSRPAILATASSQARSTPSILSLASSSKRIIQIVELLRERNMAFAFCLDENEMLLQAALGLLFETLELGSDSAVHKDNAKLVGLVMGRLESNSVPGHAEFRKFLEILFKDNAPRLRRNSSEESKTNKSQHLKSPQKRGLRAFASRLTSSSNRNTTEARRGTLPSKSPQHPSIHGQNNDASMNIHQIPLFARSEPALSPPQAYSTLLGRQSKRNMPPASIANGSMTSMGIHGLPLTLANNDDVSGSADWERLLSNLDNGQSTIWDGIYGSGPCVQQKPPPSLGDYSSLASSSPKGMTSINAATSLGGTEGIGTRFSWSPLNSWALVPDFNAQNVNVPQSVMSFTSDETPNIDDFAELGFSAQAPDNGFGKAIVIAGVGSPSTISASNDVDLFAGLDLNFGT